MNNESPAQTADDSITKDEDLQVSQHRSKPNVSGSCIMLFASYFSKYADTTPTIIDIIMKTRIDTTHRINNFRDFFLWF